MAPTVGGRRRRCFTMVEMVISMAIVGVMLVAALNTVGAAAAGRASIGYRARGTLLAHELMTEILRQEYESPDYAPGSFGRDPTEAATGDRSLYNDVDDYDDWTANPPERKDGTTIPGFVGWRRSVVVDWVDPGDLSQVEPADTRAKLITITAERDDVLVATITAVRTGASAYEPNQSPSASCTPTKTVVALWEWVGFDARASTDPDGDALSFYWDFGDGSFGSGDIQWHQFANSGDYTVRLAVVDERGGFALVNTGIRVLN